MRFAAVLAAIVAVSLSAPALAGAACGDDYRPAEQPPFGGKALPPPIAHPEGEPAPDGFSLDPREAIAIADATDPVMEERLESPSMSPEAYTRGDCLWEVKYFTRESGARTEVAQVLIDDADGTVLEAWRDHQVEVKLARGYDGAVGRSVNSAWIWIPLCVLFVAPFFDHRRPFRLVHLDLLAIVGLSVSLFFFNRGEITASVALTYPVLGYLFIRMLLAGLLGSRDREPLVPFAPIRWLAIAAVVLTAGRIALTIADSSVIDVGLAGVVGADRIEHGQELYEGEFAPREIDLRGDVYGPVNYLAYAPFEQLFPWSGEWDDVPAAHAAAIGFDLLAVLALLVAGRRLRRGDAGRELGVALAFAWLACPWTLYAMNASTGDALVAALIAAALAALSVPALRGAFIALGTFAKAGPLALAPLFATGTGERRWRSALIFSIAFVLIGLAVTLPFLPDGGYRELYDRTFGYQASRGSPFSVWGLAPSLDGLQTVARILVVVLGIAVAFIPRRKTPAQVAALGAALLIATQVAGTHWFYFYVVWFLPLVLAAAFLAHEQIAASSRRSGSEDSPASAS